jgi:hypothetical protein
MARTICKVAEGSIIGEECVIFGQIMPYDIVACTDKVVAF